MKVEESLVRDYLLKIGYQNIEYEPNGNFPPDFLLNSEIAVEVRRLNQHYSKEGQHEPLEKLEYSLVPKFLSIIDNFKVPEFKRTKAVTIRFQRPVRKKKEIFIKFQKLIKQESQADYNEKTFHLSENVSIRFTPLNKKHDKPFILGTINDLDNACLLVAELYKNLKIIIKEKELKVTPHYKKYKKWWLAVVDKIAFNYEDSIIQQLKELPKIETIFEKILIVSSWQKDVGFFYK